MKGHLFFISCAISYDNGLYNMKSVINRISNYKTKSFPKEHLITPKRLSSFGNAETKSS